MPPAALVCSKCSQPIKEMLTWSFLNSGQGVDFDSDGGLQISPDHKYLYAVSPASDTITVFSVSGSCLERIQEVYGGDQPVSLTYSWERKLMYVLDQSVATPGIRGYHIRAGGTLAPIGNQTIPISTPIGVPGTVIFVNDGEGLVVTNKIVSTLSSRPPYLCLTFLGEHARLLQRGSERSSASSDDYHGIVRLPSVRSISWH